MNLLFAWADFLDTIRQFFKSRGYLEVSTPILQPYPNVDPNVEPLELQLNLRGEKKKFWLHTSPEHSMKKMLADYPINMFQIVKVFRDGEYGRLHRPEFTMLEWYRIGTDYMGLIEEIGELLKLFGFDSYKVLELEKAFEEYLGVVLSEEEEVLKNNLVSYGYQFDDREDWESLFYRLYLELEKHLGFGEPTFLINFPSRLAIYGVVRDGYAERFELYIKGLEIANGWTEEKNPQKIKERMEHWIKGKDVPIDTELLKALEKIPNFSGCSVGLERLFMAVYNIESLDQLPWVLKIKNAEGKI
ncbi:elongation factor P--(R)-beta-lysine ligase [Thermocrinis sp.]